MEGPFNDFLDELHRREHQDLDNIPGGVRKLAELVVGYYQSLKSLGLHDGMAAALAVTFQNWHLEWASKQPPEEPKKEKPAPRTRKGPDVQDPT